MNKLLKTFLLSLWIALALTGCGQASSSTSASAPATNADAQADTKQNDQQAAAPSSENVGAEQKQADQSKPSNSDEQPASGNEQQSNSQAVITEPDDYDYVLEFPSDSYPETAMHIYTAISNGHSDVCTIDRDGADERRKQSLRGIETREGYDRDEWPMAMCAEGGEGASVVYVLSSDNRGAGSWVGHQLSAYEDGEKILFIVEKPKSLFGKKNPNEIKGELKLDEDLQIEEPVYNNCAEAHAAGVTPLFEGDPGYSKKLDRDGDGVACEL